MRFVFRQNLKFANSLRIGPRPKRISDDFILSKWVKNYASRDTFNSKPQLAGRKRTRIKDRYQLSVFSKSEKRKGRYQMSVKAKRQISDVSKSEKTKDRYQKSVKD